MKPLRVVCIGGGTGLSTLLRGVKNYVAGNGDGCATLDMDQLTAIVSVSDDGGSSGKLIDEFGVLPPGDIRNCLVALADEDETMARLFEHRFESSGHLQGHSVGNLLLIALTDLFGAFPRAIQEASRVLAVRGRILPVTLDGTTLCAELVDGSIVPGESAIPKRSNRAPIRRVFLTRREENGHRDNHADDHPLGDKPIRALPDAVDALNQADAIVIGPGSLFTSILPNIAVPEIAEALKRTSAIKIYVANVMVEPGETDGYSLSDHVNAIRRHADFPIDYVVANNAFASHDLIRQYHRVELIENRRWMQTNSKDGDIYQPDLATELQNPSEPDDEDLELYSQIDRWRVQVLFHPDVDDVEPASLVLDDLIHEREIRERDAVLRVLRHDPPKLAAAIFKLLQQHYNGDSHSA
ncbi:MAG: YvcK family protein [Candidatus Poribacteria bacterium]|nr:YvcK family protein [Candidatus Poribacteria bacterium]